MYMNERFKKAIKILGLKHNEVAEKTGLVIQDIRHLSSGSKQIKVEIAELFEKKLGISASWLLLNKGDMFDKEVGLLDNALSDFKNQTSRYSVTYYPDIKAKAGNGYFNDESSEVDIITLPKAIINKNHKPGKIDAIRVHGDSMTPTIKSDDIIFVSKNNIDIIDNKIYVLRYEDEIRVKRIFKRKSGMIILRSDNDIYPDEEVSVNDEDIQILGQVIYNMANLT